MGSAGQKGVSASEGPTVRPSMIKIRNDVVREKLEVSELGGKLKEARLRWCGRVHWREKRCVKKEGGEVEDREEKEGKTEEEMEILYQGGYGVIIVHAEEAVDRKR